MSKTVKKNIRKQSQTQKQQPEVENTGQYLQRLRTEKGLSTKEVSDTTRISEVNIKALEAQDFAALPADTFTRGLLTIYAEFLGIDPPGVISQFILERDASLTSGKRRTVKQTKKMLTPKALAEPSHVSSMTTAGILLVIIVVLFTAFCLYTSWNPFSFLTRKTAEFQSVMMHVLPGSKTEEAETRPATDMTPVSQSPEAAPAEIDKNEKNAPPGRPEQSPGR
jgi:cytoskeletal protein RodZ